MGPGGGSDTNSYTTGQVELTYPSPAWITKNLGDLKAMIADTTQMPTSVFDGANTKVKENRRNAILNQIDSAITSIQTAADTQDLKIRRAECQKTLDQINALLSKTDGVLRDTPDSKGSGYAPDWIISLRAQGIVHYEIWRNLQPLQLMIENIG